MHSALSTVRSALPLDKNIETPQVSAKYSRAVARHIESIRKKFAEKGLDTQTVRNGEVLRVTLPADQLFLPNETEITEQGLVKLSYFRQAINHPESYRLIVAVYADDTADDQYSMNLTDRRAQSLKTGLNNLADNGIVPNIDYYSFGNRHFLYPNNSVTNRAKNRRVEIYIVPEAHIIEASLAK